MYYYNTDERKRKWIGAVAAAAYLLFWVFLFFVVKFHFAESSSTGEGIMINFGNTEEAGGGDEDLPLTEEIAPQIRQVTAPSSAPREVLTQEHEPAPAVRANRPKPTQQPATTQEQPRQVDQRALFPGRTAGSTATSEGTGTGVGNQGNPAGDPAGSHDGTGTGTSGVSFDLRGRSPVGEARPDYGGNERGRFIVKVRVTVNPSGSVVGAEYQAQGSTTNSLGFVNEALKAARRQKFTPSTEENLQTGVITYIFNVG